MSKSYWFKRRRFGWGWVPVTWQGWVVVLGWMALMIGAALVLADPSGDRRFSAEAAVFSMFAVVVTAALIRVCYRKGPKPKWRWGKRPDDDPDEDF